MPVSRRTPSRRPSGLRLLGLALAGAAGAASLTVASTASAGLIPDTPASGWNLGNVTVSLDGTGSSFDPDTGIYSWGPDTDYSYEAAVDNGAGEVLGIVLAKDWPIGEPPGIKIVNDDMGNIPDGRPNNCIMSTSYLDGAFLDVVPAEDAEPVPCSGPFQSHKRFKVAMLPTTVDGGAGAEEGIDLVFNVEPEEGSRDYQVFQKINNWTNGRLDGFTIEVGTGVGAAFVPALADPGLANLSLSVPNDFFDPNQLATFSQGLFGPEDTKHDRPPGFFDQDTRAGFYIAEQGNTGTTSGQTDTLTSGAPLGSDYGELFGPWLPNNMLPMGYFFDDDGDPDTDAQLMAWYGFNEVLGELGWMYGAAGDTLDDPANPNVPFAAVLPETIAGWEADPLYSIGVIDDLVNVGLNYIVTIGDTELFDSFTIRITPSVDTSGTGVPEFIQVPSAPSDVSGVAGNTQVDVSWAAPTSDGGSAITGYTVTSSPDGATCSTAGELSCTVPGLTNGMPYTFTVTATNIAGISPSSAPSPEVTPLDSEEPPVDPPPPPPVTPPVDPVDPVDPVEPPVEPPTPAHAFMPMTPTRVLDTRTSGAAQLGDWDGSGPLEGGSTVAIPVRSIVPADSPVAVVNLTATRAAEAGFLTVYECDAPLPNASNLNYLPGEDRARAAEAYAPVSAEGQVCVYSSATTDVIVDVSGYTPSDGSYVPRNPVRLADTRAASPLAANATLRVDPLGDSGWRSGEALAISVTSVNAAGPGFLTAYSCDDGLPAISTLNYTTGAAIANLTIVDNGDICVTTSAQTDVIVDLQGHFTESVALDKARLLDTRSGTKPAAGSTTSFDPTSIPAFADSPMAAVNVTATRATEGGFLTVWNCADPLPTASVLNYDSGDTFAIANLAMVKTTSPICVYNSAPTDIIVDLVAVTP